MVQRALATVSLFLASVVLAACSGKTLAAQLDDASSDGASGVCKICSETSDAGGDGRGGDARDADIDSSTSDASCGLGTECLSSGADAGSDGSACIEIVASSFDQSCQTSGDCIPIATGQLCAGYTCLCPGAAAINVSGQASYDSALSSIRSGTGPLCQCPASPAPLCLGGVCTACSGLPTDPPACHSTAPDAGSACVNVDLSTYDQSCQTSDDCIIVTAGLRCPGACDCGGAAVNVSEQHRYQNSVGSLDTLDCPCAAEGPAACIENRCTVCAVGPNAAAGCPGGG